jgi:hypothetical protein
MFNLRERAEKKLDLSEDKHLGASGNEERLNYELLGGSLCHE